FFTRWITYLCAPTFVFLSGTAAFMSMKSKGDIAASKSFLFKRGLWLVVLEFTVVNFGIWFDVKFDVLIFEVIAAIGFGFIILGLLLRVSARALGLIGLFIILFHNLIPVIAGPDSPVLLELVSALFSPGALPYGDGKLFIMGYPPIPWLGIMLVGFGAGHYFMLDEHKQRSIFLKAGLIAIGTFLILRMINLYGDPAPWVAQQTSLFTVLSFLNVTKYPPSLQFCLLFLGMMLVIIALVQNVRTKWISIVCVYGKVPLFYFLVHWYIIHPLVFVMIYLQGFSASDMLFGTNFGRPKIGSGIGLWQVYLVWVGTVVIMYPLCKWYGRYKEQHKEKKWLRYV
ncbi:MAG: DUF1624 domain-containing protein, partial [Chitinophagaceae bacterium]